MIDKVSNVSSGSISTAETAVKAVSAGSQTAMIDSSAVALDIPGISSNQGSIADTLNEAIDSLQKNDKKQLSDDDVKRITNKLNDEMVQMNLELKFTWYKELEQLGMKMIDSQTQKTIKSFPPEDLIKTLIRTKEWIGKFLDENA